MTDATETGITVSLDATILKADDEQRIVYGWVSVYAENGTQVVDRQGDQISEAEVVKMAHRFVTEARVAKRMHGGSEDGTVVESVVLTADLQKALGISLGKEGWLIGMHVKDDDAWEAVKGGKIKGLSIGGKGVRIRDKSAEAGHEYPKRRAN